MACLSSFFFFLVCQSGEMKVMSSSPFSHYVTFRFIRDGCVAGAKKGDTDYTMRERKKMVEFLNFSSI